MFVLMGCSASGSDWKSSIQYINLRSKEVARDSEELLAVPPMGPLAVSSGVVGSIALRYPDGASKR